MKKSPQDFLKAIFSITVGQRFLIHYFMIIIIFFCPINNGYDHVNVQISIYFKMIAFCRCLDDTIVISDIPLRFLSS